MFAAWLAGKTTRLVILILAVLALLALPALAIQTVRLDGVSLLGWRVVEGALAARDAARHDAEACHVTDVALGSALAKQNAHVTALAKASAAAQVRARKALGAAHVQSAKAASAEVAILSTRPGADLCRSADALILESVK